MTHEEAVDHIVGHHAEAVKLHARIAALESELAEAKKALMVSESFRRAYRDGKLALYAIAGEVSEAAMAYLPCSEGPLERYSARIEREHSPLLLRQNQELREALAEARKDAERLDWIETQLNVEVERRPDGSVALCGDNLSRIGNSSVRSAIDAAMKGKEGMRD